MTREETIEALQGVALSTGYQLDIRSATAIYDQFIAPLEANAINAASVIKRAEMWQSRAEAAEAARDEALALLAEARAFVTGWRASDDLIARIDAALAPAMEKEEG